MYSTKSLYKELNMLPIKEIYLKGTAINLKNHNLSEPILHKINTRYVKKQFSRKKT